jgi:hypothetical protein
MVIAQSVPSLHSSRGKNRYCGTIRVNFSDTAKIGRVSLICLARIRDAQFEHGRAYAQSSMHFRSTATW